MQLTLEVVAAVACARVAGADVVSASVVTANLEAAACRGQGLWVSLMSSRRLLTKTGSPIQAAVGQAEAADQAEEAAL